MTKYSISDLESISGVKAHTIRAWEKRYGKPAARRSSSNVRYYLEEELQWLLDAAALVRNGYKISKVVLLPPDEIVKIKGSISSEESIQVNVEDFCRESMLTLRPDVFHKAFDASVSEIGFTETILRHIIPFLKRLGVLWMTGKLSPFQQKFIAGLIKRKLFAAIDSVPSRTEGPVFLLFLPEKESHELYLLLLYYELASRGFQVVNLGRNISMEDLLETSMIIRPDYVVTIINEAQFEDPVRDYVIQLSSCFMSSTILLNGVQITKHKITSDYNYQVFNQISDFLPYFDRLVERE